MMGNLDSRTDNYSCRARAIVATLQINAAFEDPVVYFVALYSLVCALLSLVFGCLYIVRFNTMRAPHKAINWAEVLLRSLYRGHISSENIMRSARKPSPNI